MSVGAVGGAGGGGMSVPSASGGSVGAQGAGSPSAVGGSSGASSPEGGDQAKKASEAGGGCPQPIPSMNTETHISLSQQSQVNQVQEISPQDQMMDDMRKLIEMMIMLKMLEELGKQ